MGLSLLATGCGSSLVTVPNVTGVDASTAAKKLTNDGLAYNSQGVNGTINCPPAYQDSGNVFSQNPGAGSKVQPGTTVTFTACVDTEG